MPDAEMSGRIRRAISNPHVTMLGHMTGRLLTKRAGYSLDEEIIFAEAKKNNVIIELNSNPYRMDIDYKYFTRLSELGIMISINPDSHSINDAMPCINYGVNAVNLGAMPEGGIFNAKSAEEAESFFNFKKEIAGRLNK
jgi:DNA polymerase (family 10)